MRKSERMNLQQERRRGGERRGGDRGVTKKGQKAKI